MNLIDLHVGRTLKLKRQRIGKGMTEVALVADIAPETLNGIEKGERRASAEQLMRLCTALDMRPADVFADASVEEPPLRSSEPGTGHP